MPFIDLSPADWTLQGLRPWTWKMGATAETGAHFQPDIGPLPAKVPGTVQQALLEAGELRDWYVGRQSLEAEWVEHRHWLLSADLPEGLDAEPGPIRFHAEMLDYSGWVLVDGREVGRFHGALTPHEFDITEQVRAGGRTVQVLFEEPPDEQGQIGWSSKSRHFKPRFNYSWDWCPRFVPSGIWGTVGLRTGVDAAFSVGHVKAALGADFSTGCVELSVAFDLSTGPPMGDYTVRGELRANGTVLGHCDLTPGGDAFSGVIDRCAVKPWWPNGLGGQPLYDVAVEAHNRDGEAVWSATRRVGFKHIEWRPCEGAPADAEPWLCVVNGEPVFLQGVNWSPVLVNYQDAAPERYKRLVATYADIGCNLFRVWGGAMLESAAFYDLCDRAGILVWQEFPLSSSGIDNAPPDAPEAIDEVCRIARSYIRLRHHHAALLMWGGGNELTRIDSFVPCDATHPCLAALEEVVLDEDPGTRFVAASPTGPRFSAAAAEFGQGLHHDVHGPWGMGGFENLAAWRDYWEQDDALFRSEVGMPGAAPAGLIRRYAGQEAPWPPTNEFWRHSSAWWVQWDRFGPELAGLEPEAALEKYARITQAFQAEAYAIAAGTCKGRFPRCGGFVVWMGHDCFPCPVNNSLIDFDGCPKPACDALKAVFLKGAG